jgi:septum formation protein
MTQNAPEPPRLYLASGSPRRRELLTQIGIPHRVLEVPAPAGEDEPRHVGESPSQYVVRTAREKCERGVSFVQQQRLPMLPVLAADTTVILGDDILGKPVDRADALRMLRRLSGGMHEVRTAIALHAHGTLRERVSVTQVRMRELSDDDILRYWESGEPVGKAGAYGIQGKAGMFIAHISGSYTGVMGLPVYETAELLRAASRDESSTRGEPDGR